MNDNGVFKIRGGFTIVGNTAVRDKRLSEKALGLYVRIASYITIPDDKVTKAKIKGWCNSGEKAFESAWQELKKQGYLVQTMRSDGTGWYIEYELLEEPRKDGVHTIYQNAAGVVTSTNITRQAKRQLDAQSIERNTQLKEKGKAGNNEHLEQEKDGISSELQASDNLCVPEAEPEKFHDKSRYPLFGSNGNGSNGKGGNIKNNTINNINNSSHLSKLTLRDSLADVSEKEDLVIGAHTFLVEGLLRQVKAEQFSKAEQKMCRYLLDLLATSVFETDENKIDLGNYGNPDLKKVLWLQDLFRKKLNHTLMEQYLRKVENYPSPIRDPVRFHLASLYRECQKKKVLVSQIKKNKKNGFSNFEERSYTQEDLETLELGILFSQENSELNSG